jgi:RNA polymerase sigma-70 factor, ECF subfamily
VHADAESLEATDWPRIVALYDRLYSVSRRTWSRPTERSPSPRLRVQMGRSRCSTAIAPDLDGYHLFHAARGTMLLRLEQRDAAQTAFERAARLAPTGADRRFLALQIEELAETQR